MPSGDVLTASDHPFGFRRARPFLAATAVAVASLTLPSAVHDWQDALVALPLMAGLLVAAALLPWQRLPLRARAVPPLAFFGVVALLRDAQGGSTSGFAPLLMLPVIWLAMYGSRRQTTAAVAGVGLTMALPMLLVGAPRYPSSHWRGVLLLFAVAWMVGLAVSRLVHELDDRERRVAASEANLAAMAGVVREIQTGGDPRAVVLAAVGEIADADFAFLWEPDGHGNLAVAASYGGESPVSIVPLSSRASGAVAAFHSGERVSSLDAQSDAEVAASGAAASGAAALGVRSVLFEPVLLRGETVGVLMAAWRDSELGSRETAAVRLLADEAAVALEQQALLRRLQDLATTDALTGLPNRRFWDERLAREVESAARTGRPLVAVMLDLDHFKAFNDLHGHSVGDRLLVGFAGACLESVRSVDLVARWGGEEFALLLPDCSLAAARTVTERLRAAVPHGQTCSAGLALLAPGESPATLVARADRALYVAKGAGRDRLVVDEDVPARV